MPGLLTVPNAPNFAATVSPWVITNTTRDPGEPVFTELAQSFMPLEGRTSLSELFPDETILERLVLMEQRFQSGDTIFPLVEMGKPDIVLGHNYGTTRQMYVQPLYIRRSTFISYGEINSKIRPHTMNERWSPNDQVAMIVQGMVREHNLTWDVYRGMMLLGGISYTDPRTGVGAAVSSQIPAQNLWSYKVSVGHRGRNEANLFRSIADSNAVGPSYTGMPWSHPDADFAGCMQRLLRWFKETNKSKITAMYMAPELRDVISMSNQARMSQGGTAIIGAMIGDLNLKEGAQLSGDMTMGMITIGADGVSAICGVPIRTVETQFKDPVDGISKYIWPKNKVVLVAEQDANGGTEALGRTQYCVSEESGGAPGLWTRTQTQTQIPAAPGMYMQMGNAGMPYLKYPYRVMHMTVAEVDGINERMGVLGDLNWGQF